MKTAQKIVSITIILIIFYFLITTLISNWQKIPFAELRFGPFSLLLSFVFLFIYFLMLALGWRNIVKELGGTIQFPKAFWIISTSQIAKYVPGGIWYTLGRVFLCKTEKIRGEIIVLSVILETCILMLTNLVLFLISLIFFRDAAVLHPLLSVVFIVVLLIILYPPLLNWLLNVALKIMKRPLIKLEIKYLHMLRLCVYFFGVWLAQIIGFFLLINSIYPMSASQIFSLAAAYTLSWITGFIVLFAPGGLGVREGMMSLLLSSQLPLPLAIAMSFIARVWIIVFEVIMFFLGLLVKRVVSSNK